MDCALIVEDHPAIRMAVSAQLVSELGAREVLEAGNARQALQLVRDHLPELVIVDLDLPGPSGIDLIRRIAAAHASVRLLVLSGMDTAVAPARALRAGAHGFVAKASGLAELVQAVRGVLTGYLVFPVHTLDAVRKFSEGDAGKLPRLSNREVTILRYLARGQSNKAIAAELMISSKTVSTHKANIMSKLDVGSLVEMVDYARRHQLVW